MPWLHRWELDREGRQTRCEKRQGPTVDPGSKRPRPHPHQNIELELVHKENLENRKVGGGSFCDKAAQSVRA